MDRLSDVLISTMMLTPRGSGLLSLINDESSFDTTLPLFKVNVSINIENNLGNWKCFKILESGVSKIF